MNNIGTGDLIISSYSISGDTRLSVTGPTTPITLPDTGGTQTLTVACATNDIPNPNTLQEHCELPTTERVARQLILLNAG